MTKDQAELIIAKKNEILDLLLIEIQQMFYTRGVYKPNLYKAEKIGDAFNQYVRGLAKEN